MLLQAVAGTLLFISSPAWAWKPEPHLFPNYRPACIPLSKQASLTAQLNEVLTKIHVGQAAYSDARQAECNLATPFYNKAAASLHAAWNSSEGFARELHFLQPQAPVEATPVSTSARCDHTLCEALFFSINEKYQIIKSQWNSILSIESNPYACRSSVTLVCQLLVQAIGDLKLLSECIGQCAENPCAH